MLSLLEKVRYSIATLAIGSAFVVLALYRIVDIRKGQLERLAQPVPVLLWIGVALLLVSLFAGVVSQFGDALWLPDLSRRVKKTATGWTTHVNQASIEVVSGRLERLAPPRPDTLVVLPANEYFDDECIRDTRSALGAFVEEHFPQQKEVFLDALRRALKDCPTTDVERFEGELRPSYGVGTTAYLPRALGTGFNILMVAVTTQRAGEGLRAEIRTIFTIADSIVETMADHRLTSVAVPLIGAGHGGLRVPAALSALIVAFIEVLSRPAAHGIKNVTLVAFQRAPDEKPSMSPRLVRRIMARAVDLYAA
jgi:antiphage defense system Thoeris ThsA-like protein